MTIPIYNRQSSPFRCNSLGLTSCTRIALNMNSDDPYISINPHRRKDHKDIATDVRLILEKIFE